MLMPETGNRFPRMIQCRQELFKAPIAAEAIAGLVGQQCDSAGMGTSIRAGMRVAIAAGSRGIASYDKVVGAVVGYAKERGAEPFVFPAMGSHGGATPEGQRDTLAALGITEGTMGCPILSSLEAVTLGETADGVPVFLDKHASEADAIVIVNRIKPHTNFHGTWESGLCKMLVIGAGKHRQAITMHGLGTPGLRDHMPNVARIVLAKAPVVAGIALIEDAHHALSRIEGIPAADLMDREAALLDEVRANSPSLPVTDIDLLIIERIGKQISGTGIDTNVVGRCRLLDFHAFDSPRVRCLVALDLTDDSHGNAIGIGLADLITTRLAGKVDHRITAVNCITGLSPQLAALPIALDTDREVIRTALDYFCAHVPFDRVRVVRIRDTLSLGELEVSESLRAELAGRPRLSLGEEAREMRFTDDGALI